MWRGAVVTIPVFMVAAATKPDKTSLRLHVHREGATAAGNGLGAVLNSFLAETMLDYEYHDYIFFAKGHVTIRPRPNATYSYVGAFGTWLAMPKFQKVPD